LGKERVTRDRGENDDDYHGYGDRDAGDAALCCVHSVSLGCDCLFNTGGRTGRRDGWGTDPSEAFPAGFDQRLMPR
jgi:hypothetical protein